MIRGATSNLPPNEEKVLRDWWDEASADERITATEGIAATKNMINKILLYIKDDIKIPVF